MNGHPVGTGRFAYQGVLPCPACQKESLGFQVILTVPEVEIQVDNHPWGAQLTMHRDGVVWLVYRFSCSTPNVEDFSLWEKELEDSGKDWFR